MRELEEKILKEGIILPGEVLNVGGFLNQQIDTILLKNMALEVKRLFPTGINKVLTIEASGLPFATAIAMEYGVPMIFAKKSLTSNVSGGVYQSTVFSYTHKTESYILVSKDYINDKDNILIADDFLAKGNALKGLIDICSQAGAKIVGAAIEIEKSYQGGGNLLRNQGLKIESLASIKSMSDTTIEFD